MKYRKAKKRLDARIADFYRSMDNMAKRGLDSSGYHCPGSMKK